MPAMLTKQVPYTIMKQLSFEYFTTFLYSIVAVSTTLSKMDLKWEISVVSAFLASILACIASQPGDLLLTETYKGRELTANAVSEMNPDIDNETKTEVSDDSDGNLSKLISNVLETEGFLGFFVGLKPRLIHVASIITSQLVLYDFIKQLLGLPATGSS